MGISVPHLLACTEKNSAHMWGMIIQTHIGKSVVGGFQNLICQHRKLFSLNMQESTG